MTRALIALFCFRFLFLSNPLYHSARQALINLIQTANRQQENLPTTPAPSPIFTPTLVRSPTSTPGATLSAPNPSSTPSDPNTPTATPSQSLVSPAASPSPGGSPSATPPATTAASPSPTSVDSPAPTAGHVPTGLIVINEVAWSGTFASAHDEWIELHNTSPDAVSLGGWLLTDSGDINISLSGMIAPYGYLLLERTDDSSVADVAADIIYTGALNNGGEALALLDRAGSLIDSANQGGGSWPAGDTSSRDSMERWGGSDSPGNWKTYGGSGGNGHDAAGNPVNGTPRQPNSMYAISPTASPTSTPTPTATLGLSSYPPGSVRINEVAWAGTHASASDEWIELYNPGEASVNLDGWRLSDGGDISIVLQGSLPVGGFYLLERTDDSTILNIDADLIYTGSLSNSGESLMLHDAVGGLIDTANLPGGGWPGGSAQFRSSMERRYGADDPAAWGSFTGYHGRGQDAAGNPVWGTPRGVNSQLFPTPTPTWIPGKLVINEVLIRPHYDWEGAGGIDTGDEFIELLNLGPGPVNTNGWLLDDIPGAGSAPYMLGAAILEPGAYRAFFRTRTHLALNDSGDTVRLLAPDGRVVDSVSYLRVRAYNLSFGRYPNGSGSLRYGLWPTPGKRNLPFDEDLREAPPPTLCRPSGQITIRLPRLTRSSRALARMNLLGMLPCLTERPQEPQLALSAE